MGWRLGLRENAIVWWASSTLHSEEEEELWIVLPLPAERLRFSCNDNNQLMPLARRVLSSFQKTHASKQ